MSDSSSRRDESVRPSGKRPVVSVVMPFWRRREVAIRTLEQYARLYKPELVEVVLVDDGSPDSTADGLEDVYGGAKVIKLPPKDGPLNPCVPINVGVAYASGVALALSNPEVYHEQDTLGGLLRLLIGPLDYAVAPAWCPELEVWHAHPSLAKHATMEVAAGHFLAVFQRDLWEAVGGFDPMYRYGFGWDDTDWIRSVLDVGGRIKWGETPVLHFKSGGARIDWGVIPSNSTIFEEKWKARAHGRPLRFTLA